MLSRRSGNQYNDKQKVFGTITSRMTAGLRGRIQMELEMKLYKVTD